MKKEKIDRSFLKFTYSWSDESADYAMENLNLENGPCVLEFINWFFDSYELTSRRSCEQIEELLHKVPRYYRSRNEAAKWICRNWTSEAIYINPALVYSV
jgi:hypothetical protein